MATLLFYERPVPLNADIHRQTRLGRLNNDFLFCQATNSIPLAAVEFFDAAREFPIAFTGREGEAPFPIAIVGVRQNENLLIEPDGRWGGRYVPAFVRRYPFVLAEKENAEDFNVYIDEGYAGYGAQDGERLFTDEGERTALLTQALDFLSVYQGEIRRTRLFVEKLQALDLLVPRVLEVTRAGQSPLVLQGFSVVDEQKLQSLDDAQGNFWVYDSLLSEYAALGYEYGYSHSSLDPRAPDVPCQRGRPCRPSGRACRWRACRGQHRRIRRGRRSGEGRHAEAARQAEA